MILAALLVLFAVFILLGIPIAYILGLVPVGYFLLSSGSVPSIILSQKIIGGCTSFTLMAIPFFVLAGNLMNGGGITKRLINFCNALVGHIRGGLAVADVICSMFLGGISGSANADTAALGVALVPEMVEKGYDKDFAMGLTVAANTVGPIIPPSISMVVYGSLAGVSVGALFLGGFVPGILIGLVLSVMAIIFSAVRKYPKTGKFSFKNLWLSFKQAILALGMPVIILGGVLTGICTPTEAAAVAVVYSFIIGFFVFKTFTLKSLYSILEDTIVLSASIFVIIGFSNILAYLVASERMPQLICDWLLASTGNNKYLVLFIINVILLIMGMFLDPSASMILLTPILVPIAKTLGIDLIHLGVVVVMNVTIGLTTPPVGTCLYIGASMANLPVMKLFKAMAPFLAANIAVLLLVTYCPQLVTMLSQLV
ncbi:TRAP transporter large permease [uncultured Dysosmobacter sp.]|uniref:TRAP transporter large permease n=1 Tax=uncultured Dysosmobacter sp. TaxID=2591384 RepID=UPI0026154B0A|nr:TRAP transporter large permease [uncultured Dysosmobacter sp.]